ncbi:protein GVQW3-like [Eupeodes corollae]|uniref:protein GVQW3-like n=1 Tax=Eupeodes corollae TaxID=290404 RepID=UPI00248F4E3E|nr:protein GVQW3-like [Eupeodes corollae]
MATKTMMVKIEHRAVIKFLTKQGKSQKTIHEEMVAVYQGSAPSLSTVQKWSSEFKRGRESIEDDPRSGALASACTGESIKEVEKLVLEDARIKVKMMAEITKLSTGTIHTILHDHLNLSKVSARWVPRMLTAPQKKVRIACCRELLEMCSENADGVMHRIVTGDETWVHYYDPESKQESCSGIKKEQTSRRSSKSLRLPGSSWPQFFGTQRESYSLSTKKR